MHAQNLTESVNLLLGKVRNNDKFLIKKTMFFN